MIVILWNGFHMKYFLEDVYFIGAFLLRLLY